VRRVHPGVSRGTAKLESLRADQAAGAPSRNVHHRGEAAFAALAFADVRVAVKTRADRAFRVVHVQHAQVSDAADRVELLQHAQGASGGVGGPQQRRCGAGGR